MSTSEFVLQIIPKIIEFKQQTDDYVKVTCALYFGIQKYKSPYTRWVRQQKASFYGERLKLHNYLNQKASFVLMGIDKTGQQAEVTKINIDVIKLAEKEEILNSTFQNQQIKFQYQVLIFERESSQDDYEQILQQKIDNKTINFESILINFQSSNFEDRSQIIKIDKREQKSTNSIQCIDIELELKNIKQEKVKPQFQNNTLPQILKDQNDSIYNNTLLLQSDLLQSSTSIQDEICQLNIVLKEVSKQPLASKSLLLAYLLYILISCIAFYSGIWVKQLFVVQ